MKSFAILSIVLTAAAAFAFNASSTATAQVPVRSRTAIPFQIIPVPNAVCVAAGAGQAAHGVCQPQQGSQTGCFLDRNGATWTCVDTTGTVHP